MDNLFKLLMSDPALVFDSGVIIPCALQDHLRLALEDGPCRRHSEGNVVRVLPRPPPTLRLIRSARARG